MPKEKKEKKASEMTDDELLHDIFPKELIDHMKEVAHAARKKPKQTKKK